MAALLKYESLKMYLGLDLGTSGVKAILIDDTQSTLAESSASLTVERPQPLWSEQDPLSWINACEKVIADIRTRMPKEFTALRGIGVSGQMHGATLLDGAGKPLRPAILWNDGRSHQECLELEEAADFRGIGGNIVMAGFTAPKLRWVEKHEPEVFEQIKQVLLPKDYVNFWLTGEYVSEMSDAAGTLWLDVKQRDWSDELLEATHLHREHMPRLVEGSQVAGNLRSELAQAWGVSNVVVAGGAGDNAATACGLGVVGAGDGFLSLGTSGVLFTVTDRFAKNTESAVHSFCHAVPGVWHQMGVILSATDALAWFAQITGKDSSQLAGLIAEKGSGPSPITFLPYLSGERTPHNAPNAAGSFHGLRREHDLSDMVQAIMEGVAFAFADCCEALADCKSLPTSVWVAGGGSQSSTWLKMISSVTGLELKVPESGVQGAALGAARLAITAANKVSEETILKTPIAKAIIEPDLNFQDAYACKYDEYKSAWRLQNR